MEDEKIFSNVHNKSLLCFFTKYNNRHTHKYIELRGKSFYFKSALVIFTYMEPISLHFVFDIFVLWCRRRSDGDQVYRILPTLSFFFFAFLLFCLSIENIMEFVLRVFTNSVHATIECHIIHYTYTH